MNSSRYIIHHHWNVSLEEAKQIQQRLSERIVRKDDLGKIETLLGIGIVFSKKQDQVSIGCVSFSFPGFEILEMVFQRCKITFPYIPGFFAFSAGPAILSALKKIEKPDLIIFPGRGIAHPRGLGLASHLGILLDIPTIACSKTPLWKDCPEPCADKGAHILIRGEYNKLVGAVVRTREDKKPVFVTQGHRVSIQTAIRIVLQCSPTFRIPEPLRQAQILAKEILVKTTV